MERHTDTNNRQFPKEKEPVTYNRKTTTITLEELVLGFNFDTSVWERYKKILEEENERYYNNEMD